MDRPSLRLPVVTAVALLLAAAALAQPIPAGTGLPGPPESFGVQIEALSRAGALTMRRVQPDHDFPDRQHIRFDQRVDGVRVFGAQLVQQIDAEGRTLSVFGHIDEGLRASVAPALGAEAAVRAAEAASPSGSQVVGEPELVLLPRDGGPVLTWTMHVRFDQNLDRVFVDAVDGHVVWRYDDLRTDASVGLGTGVWADRKKVSVDSVSGVYQARDILRPPLLETYHLRFDVNAVNNVFRTGVIPPSYIAVSSDNNWGDGAIVDAHVYAGWTYDYYYERHGRRGIDDHDLPIRSVAHFLPRSYGYANAFWDSEVQAMFYGDGDASDNAFSGALDVVAHELTHGVTQYTWDGIYSGESGALNEAFSDIMGTAVEFFREPPGVGRQRADYYLGEDLPYQFDPPRTATRSMENPSMFCSATLGTCSPDHYSKRYRGSLDNGGVHYNSGIANQAFYLLVEGGTNRTSGVHVTGLGAALRDSAERIFYRGFTLYLTPGATFKDARAATMQAAADLYGASEVAAVAAAWTAVGVE